MTTTKILQQSDLDQFTGSENWYRHPMTGMSYTDGVKYMAEVAGAYWLVDDILIAQRFERKLAGQEFLVWKLTKNKTGRGAKLVAEDGNDNKLYAEKIDFTDFPLDEITLFLENRVLYLPSER